MAYLDRPSSHMRTPGTVDGLVPPRDLEALARRLRPLAIDNPTTEAETQASAGPDEQPEPAEGEDQDG